MSNFIDTLLLHYCLAYKTLKDIPLSAYQNTCRIYLDEYEVEEVDLRVNFDTSILMKRFMVKE